MENGTTIQLSPRCESGKDVFLPERYVRLCVKLIMDVLILTKPVSNLEEVIPQIILQKKNDAMETEEKLKWYGPVLPLNTWPNMMLLWVKMFLLEEVCYGAPYI